MEKEIGSLEPGKKADIILLDWFKPHLVPMNMPVYRVVYYANGEDVSTVLVDGRILMRDRRVLTVDEKKILNAAQRESNLAIQPCGIGERYDQVAGWLLGDDAFARRGTAVTDRGAESFGVLLSVFATLAACSGSDRVTTPAAQGLSKVNHIIIVMMENHSFDNYFGALAYAPGSPYHTSSSGLCAG